MLQCKPQQFIGPVLLRLRLQQLLAARLEQLAVVNACGTRLFTRAATETPIDMPGERRRRILEPPLRDRAHEINPPARRIILIPRHDIRRTRLQTQPTMNTREQLLLFSGQ